MWLDLFLFMYLSVAQSNLERWAQTCRCTYTAVVRFRSQQTLHQTTPLGKLQSFLSQHSTLHTYFLRQCTLLKQKQTCSHAQPAYTVIHQSVQIARPCYYTETVLYLLYVLASCTLLGGLPVRNLQVSFRTGIDRQGCYIHIFIVIPCMLSSHSIIIPTLAHI